MISGFFKPVRNAELPIPVASPREAAAFLKKNLAYCVYNTLRLLEKNPTSLPDTKLILDGRTVAGLSVEDLIQVKRFGDAAKLLIRLVLNKEFGLDVPIMESLHAVVGKDEALEWGVLRKSQVFVGDCLYIPPDAANLQKILHEGINELRLMANPLDQALNTFAFLSKIQPFFDCNKRTAMLVANGILLSGGVYPLFIPASLDKETARAIDELYEYGNAALLLEVFHKSCVLMYPSDVNYGERFSKAVL